MVVLVFNSSIYLYLIRYKYKLFYNDLDKFSLSTHTHTWTDITGKPSTFTPASHNHDDIYYTESEITNLLKNYTPITVFTTKDIGSNTTVTYPDNTLICVYEEV